MVLTLWPTALGFPDAVGRDVRVWPNRLVVPTVGVSPNVVAHGGKNSKRRGSRHQMYISRKFWFDQLFFENHDKLNITKILPRPPAYEMQWIVTTRGLNTGFAVLSARIRK
jgi:hypothetical protein